MVEILGSAESAPAVIKLPPIPEDQPQLAKFTADLRRRLAEEGAADKPLRLEVVLVASPPEEDIEWRQPFHQAGATIEGRVGPVVTVTVPKGSQAANVAALADVASVRLPRVSSPATGDQPAGKAVEPKEEKKESPVSADEPKTPTLPRPEAASEDVLRQTGLDRLHAMNARGQGVRVVVIDTDFAGWQERLAAPAKDPRTAPRVTFLDLTAEARNREVAPGPDARHPRPRHARGPGRAPGRPGRGADPGPRPGRRAVPARQHRPGRPRGRLPAGRALARRQEIESDFESLRKRRSDATAEYQRAFESFEDDPAARQRRSTPRRLSPHSTWKTATCSPG